MTVKLITDPREFVRFYKLHRDQVQFREKQALDNMLEGDIPEDFEFRHTDYGDHQQIRVSWGLGRERALVTAVLDDTRYLIYRGASAVDKIESLIEEGYVADTHSSSLGLCLGALIGIVEDGTLAGVHLSVVMDGPRLKNLFATAYNGIITVEF